ncbi:DUF6950 family protein [Erythrobacter rubeus]|uniref:DUF6950 domain-containing protein n=1 Tax=Erythrobacter rubeus TaxID=2760803 RepID=A0ABR8KU15_9SPHN|nr:hypothetical protein [Erythrobacter rubeus]MBD2842713.1 hypothetical protein [Erythrobacter rubeus]
MIRLPDWEDRLAQLLAERRFMPHDYGSNDCALFASDAVLAMTGVDPAHDFRGRYTTKIGSVRALRSIGNGDLESTFSARFDEKPVSFAQRGDLVFDGEAVGVCLGPRAVFVGAEGEREGLVSQGVPVMIKAWAVPHE